jgi:2-keto-4-pentenoate hydratase/2-oxohepta-3-ene-1,7-dioic acid hydratase in catechol pathway
MKIARVLRDGPAGPEPRVVAIDLDRGVAIDLQRTEQIRLERRGSSPAAARRLADARIPQSVAAGLGSHSYREDLETALGEDPPDDAISPIDGLSWLAPVDPPRFRDFMSFEQHHLSARRVLEREVPAVTYELPTYYKAGHLSLIGHEQPLQWPGYCEWMDYELELGFVVGSGGLDLTPEQAETCLFGVALLNDFSARDRQRQETAGNLGPAKGKDFATALGPWIATADELDLLMIELTARINGETWVTGISGSAMWNAAELLAYLSTAEPLVPGELVGSGTVGGGCGLEVGRMLAPGDVVELEGAGLGTLRNQLSSPRELAWAPPRRTPGETIDGRGGVRLTELLPPRLDAPAPPFPAHNLRSV